MVKPPTYISSPSSPFSSPLPTGPPPPPPPPILVRSVSSSSSSFLSNPTDCLPVKSSRAYTCPDPKKLVQRCLLCAFCVSASILLGSKVLSLGGTALFWPGTAIAALFLVMNEGWMMRWLAATSFIVYLIMIILDCGKIYNCLFLNLIFMITDVAEVVVVVMCLQVILAGAPPSIVRTSTLINSLLLFPLVLAPLKGGVNTLMIFICFGPLHLPLWETLVIWLIGDFFTDFFVIYGVLVLRYYLSMYGKAVEEWREGKEEVEGEDEQQMEKEKVAMVEGGGGGGGGELDGGATRTLTKRRPHGRKRGDEKAAATTTTTTTTTLINATAMYDEAKDQELARQVEEGQMSSSTTSKKDPEKLCKSDLLQSIPFASSPPPSSSLSASPSSSPSSPSPPRPSPSWRDHPLLAWSNSDHVFKNLFFFVFFLAITILTSFASVLNRMRIVNQPLFYVGARLLFPLIGYVTVRYGQLGACLNCVVVVVSMLVTDFFINEEKKNYGSIYISSFGALFQALVCPMLMVMITWSISYLAVALAERQDTLALLREKNEQLLSQEKELRQAKLAAEQALSSKTEFFARVSHEFRTPLNVVLGFSEELTKHPDLALTPETADRIQYILAAGESLLRVVDDILELFRLSSTHSQAGGQLQVNLTAVDIPSFFSTVCDLVEVISKENGQHFIKHLDPALPRYLVIDRVRFSQLVMNLASNACKYSRPAGGIVSIRLSCEGPVYVDEEEGKGMEEKIEERKEGGGGEREREREVKEGWVTMRLDVQDNGPGIPPELKERIFECFFRGDPSVEEGEEEEWGEEGEKGWGEEGEREGEEDDYYGFRVDKGGGRRRGWYPQQEERERERERERGQGGRFLSSSHPSSSSFTSTTSTVATSVSTSSTSSRHYHPTNTTTSKSRSHRGPPHTHTHTKKDRNPRPDTGTGPRPRRRSRHGPPPTPTRLHMHKSKGHGLGLAITKQLVDLLHGKIDVQSSLGLGSLFSIYLPAKIADGCTGEEDWSQGAAAAGGGGGGGAGGVGGTSLPPIRELKILSVEDILVNQIVLGGMLQQDGHHVVFVETGTAALAAIDASFDVILLDLQLPDMHGIEVLETLRKHRDPALASMPIVVVSALALDKEKQECAMAGADGFITKPVKLDLLRKELRFLWDEMRLKKAREERERVGKEREERERVEKEVEERERVVQQQQRQQVKGGSEEDEKVVVAVVKEEEVDQKVVEEGESGVSR